MDTPQEFYEKIVVEAFLELLTQSQEFILQNDKFKQLETFLIKQDPDYDPLLWIEYTESLVEDEPRVQRWIESAQNQIHEMCIRVSQELPNIFIHENRRGEK